MAKGQLIPRGPERWVLRVYTGMDEKGKRHYANRTVRGSQAKAQKILNKMLVEKDTGMLLNPTKDTVGSYVRRWLETTVSMSVSVRTHKDYTDIHRRYIDPAVGRIRLAQLSPLHVQKFCADLSARGLQPRTVEYAHAVLRGALNHAVKMNILPRNPALNATLPQKKRKEMKVMDRVQAAAFMEAAKNDRFGAYWYVLLTTGMRPGEALALRWSDLKENRVHIQRALVYRAGMGRQIQETKTDGSRRSIPLTPATITMLDKHRKRRVAERLAAGQNYQDANLIFATRTGGMLDSSQMAAKFKRVLGKVVLPDAAAMPDLRMYDLRHTCATLLLLAGENLKVVSERLGHKNISITADIYAHVLPDMQQTATDRMAELLA